MLHQRQSAKNKEVVKIPCSNQRLRKWWRLGQQEATLPSSKDEKVKKKRQHFTTPLSSVERPRLNSDSKCALLLELFFAFKPKAGKLVWGSIMNRQHGSWGNGCLLLPCVDCDHQRLRTKGQHPKGGWNGKVLWGWEQGAWGNCRLHLPWRQCHQRLWTRRPWEGGLWSLL